MVPFVYHTQKRSGRSRKLTESLCQSSCASSAAIATFKRKEQRQGEVRWEEKKPLIPKSALLVRRAVPALLRRSHGLAAKKDALDLDGGKERKAEVQSRFRFQNELMRSAQRECATEMKGPAQFSAHDIAAAIQAQKQKDIHRMQQTRRLFSAQRPDIDAACPVPPIRSATNSEMAVGPPKKVS